MYKSVFIATILVAVGYGYPTVNDIADFNTMRKLEYGDAKPIENSINYPPGDELVGLDKDYDIEEVKKAPKFKKTVEIRYKNRIEPEYLQPAWNTQDSSETEEELERVQRSIHAKFHGYDAEDDSSESYECFDDHGHHEDSDLEDDSGPDDSWEKHHKTTTGVKIGTSIGTTSTTSTSTTTTTTTPRTSTSTIPVKSSTGFYSYETTAKPAGRIDIDPRFGEVETEVRKKRMVWNVAQPSMEFGENVKPVKMRWRWDDQKPEIVPPFNYDMDNDFLKKTISLVPDVPVVNYLEPCESIYDRRDRHGRCRPVFA